jgi:chromosome partitioning protein
LGIEPETQKYLFGDVLLGKCDIEDTIIFINEYFHISPASSDLIDAEMMLSKQTNSEKRLSICINKILDSYDYIFIDCPPTLNLLTVNALIASDFVIIPTQCEYYALEGLSALMNSINQIKESLHPRLKILGILRTMLDKRSNLCKEVSKELANHFKKQIISTSIPRNVRLAEAPSYGVSVFDYDANSSGAKAYSLVAKELLKKLSKINQVETKIREFS